VLGGLVSSVYEFNLLVMLSMIEIEFTWLWIVFYGFLWADLDGCFWWNPNLVLGW